MNARERDEKRKHEFDERVRELALERKSKNGRTRLQYFVPIIRWNCVLVTYITRRGRRR